MRDTAEILLFRHGKVDFRAGAWISPAYLRKAVQTYDTAPLLTRLDTDPACRPDLVICSPLRRSIDSARDAFGGHDMVDPLFREAELPCLAHLPVRLPAQGWFVMARCLWALGADRNCEGVRDFKLRVRDAAARLDSLSRQHRRIAVIGHGLLNQYLAPELIRLGFSPTGRRVRTHGRPNCYVRRNDGTGRAPGGGDIG